MAKFTVLLKPVTILKMIQVAIAITCIALLRHYNLHFGGENASAIRDRELVGIITVGGMILVSLPLLLNNILSDGYRPLLDLMYGVMGFMLLITAGGLCLDHYHVYRGQPGNINAGKALGSLLIVNAVFYLIDAVLALRVIRSD